MASESTESRKAFARGALLVVAGASLWGTLGLFGKTLYQAGLSPLEVVSVRAAVGFAGLALWMLPRAGRLRVRARDLPFFAAYGLISIGLFYLLYFATIERAPVSVAAALLYTAPAFVVLLTWILGGPRPGRRELAALGLALAGVFLVTGALRALVTGAGSVPVAAVALGLGSGLTYGLYSIFGKRALRRYDPEVAVFYAFGFGALVLAMAEPPWQPLAAHGEARGILGILGLVPTLGAYLLYTQGLRGLPAPTASMLATVEPVVATLLGIAFLGESVQADRLLGVLLVAGTGLLLARGSSEEGAARPASGDETHHVPQ
ncbi:DMT family transporter [Limnochorda pilosa]|uniref:Transporter n=1 Tax=Limnochorda pilosa TaxID=1555112 RepID=A0A0K2SHU2_LIMPI|nr:EamA family transporter [Limnochorda pilosa]BAS26612.1 transporter [Limnochorda pilosa]